MKPGADKPSRREALAIPNIRRFIAFRVCFNARFYYPVFAILFLDFGLSLEQFALLNAVWAVAIVLLEGEVEVIEATLRIRESTGPAPGNT